MKLISLGLVAALLAEGLGLVGAWASGEDAARGRLTEVSSQKGASVLARFLSTLDPVGNPTQIVRTGALAQTQTYTYDANDRLLSVCFQAGTCPGGSDPFIRWTYDTVGNRLFERRDPVDVVVRALRLHPKRAEGAADNGREIDSGGYVHPVSPLRFNVYLANGVFRLSLYHDTNDQMPRGRVGST